MRPTSEEIQEVRANSKIWCWLEELRGNLRQLSERENILEEDFLFSQFGMALYLHNEHPLKCPACKKIFDSWRALIAHIRSSYSHRSLYQYYTFIVAGERINKDIQTQDDDNMNLLKMDLFEAVSNYNMLKMYQADPTDLNMRLRLFKLGLITTGYKVSRTGRRLLENPPVL